MRIASFKVRNFKGIRAAEVTGLQDAPVVTISGPNGSGKSLLMEALTMVWRGQAGPRPHEMIGPWGDEAYAALSLELTEEERDVVGSFANRHGIVNEVRPPKTIDLGLFAREVGGWGLRDESAHWSTVMRNEALRRQASFAAFDLLPADRTMQRGEVASINAALLGEEQREKFRTQVFNALLQNRQLVQMTGVQSFLASLDYLELVAEREGAEAPKDFQLLTDAFESSTGKTITRPVLDEATGASLTVRTPAEAVHSIDNLSSGEQEVLGLMYFVRRLSARGGVLLIDEPELHLHPALQRSLFSVLESVADRAQVWIVTHSPKLVAAAQLDAIVHIEQARRDDTNQARKASDEQGRAILMDDLGMNPVDLLQNDVVIVVEGPTDSRLLTQILPLELSRALVYEAGSASSVEATCRTLRSAGGPLPWLAIRDRDLLSSDAVARLEENLPELFVWPCRSIESELIRPQLIAITLASAGQQHTEDEITHWLSAIAEDQKGELIAALIEQRLNQIHPLPARSTEAPLNQLRDHLQSAEEVARQRVSVLDDVSREVSDDVMGRWEADWFVMMNAKRALGQLLRYTPFGNRNDFVTALAHNISQGRYLPKGIESLSDALRSLMSKV